MKGLSIADIVKIGGWEFLGLSGDPSLIAPD